jgi:hypothetical protein
VSTQKIYGVVLEIRESISSVDTRWSFFQAPLIIEDALGCKFPVPSEFDYGMLKNIIEYRFREGEGAREVKTGNYEFFRAKNSSQTLTEDVRLLPGMEITMAILIRRDTSEDEVCPILSCGSTQTEPTIGGCWRW